MATMPPKDLLALWSREQLPFETATGHILQNLVAMQATSESLKQAVYLLQAQIDNLIASSNSAPAPPTKKLGSKR